MITGEMLVEACEEQREVFRKEWPEGAEATIENVLWAVELGLDLSWGERWFTPEALGEYRRQRDPLYKAFERQLAPLYKEYERRRAPLWRAYERRRALVDKDFERQLAPFREEYERGRAPIQEEYERQIAPIWLDYQRQLAPIWLEALLASRGEFFSGD